MDNTNVLLMILLKKCIENRKNGIINGQEWHHWHRIRLECIKLIIKKNWNYDKKSDAIQSAKIVIKIIN